MGIVHNKQYENEYVNMKVKEGFHCERIAGSGKGVKSICDCILFKNGKVYLVEVKATKEKSLIMRTNIKLQLERMKKVAEEHNVIPLLAIKYKRRGWEEIEL